MNYEKFHNTHDTQENLKENIREKRLLNLKKNKKNYNPHQIPPVWEIAFNHAVKILFKIKKKKYFINKMLLFAN